MALHACVLTQMSYLSCTTASVLRYCNNGNLHRQCGLIPHLCSALYFDVLHFSTQDGSTIHIKNCPAHPADRVVQSHCHIFSGDTNGVHFDPVLLDLQIGLFNHTAWVDAVALMYLFAPSGVSKESNAHLPLVGTCIRSFQNIYVSRSSIEHVRRQEGAPSIAEKIARR